MSSSSSNHWNSESNEPELLLTSKAAQIFKEACEAEGNALSDSYLRIGANPGGCSGYRYELDFNSSESVKNTDVQFESNGVKLLVDKKCLTEVLGSVEIDYTDSNMVEQGFVFKQLRNGHQCGCGESFAPVKEM